MKKLLIVALIALMLCGCSNTKTEEPKEEVKEETKQDLDFNDISWEVYNGVLNGKRYMIMDFTNNSDFVILDYDFTFSEKDGVSEEEKTKFVEKLAESFYMTMDEMKEWGYDRIEFSSTYGEDKNILPKETVTSHLYYLHGIYRLQDEDEYKLSTPDYAEIKYIGKDNKEHTTYYDFKNNKQTYE